ncbi:MAG: hypothetical protein P8H65_10955 [Rhodothermales bacterium]|mgnify:FL=1|nr:hypothetical protein [Rhodothermales bacterium]MDG2016499.1 hypothetical protein [Rhodothermales bacterium]
MQDSYSPLPPTPMSRQEVYAWSSTLSSIVFALVYLLFVFGIPSLFEPIRENFIQAVVILVIVDVVFQTIISIQSSQGGRVDRDERDVRIAAIGFKIGYYVFMVAVLILIGHLFVYGFINSLADPVYVGRMDAMIVHYLVAVFFVGTTAKSVAQVVLYRKDA